MENYEVFMTPDSRDWWNMTPKWKAVWERLLRKRKSSSHFRWWQKWREDGKLQLAFQTFTYMLCERVFSCITSNLHSSTPVEIHYHFTQYFGEITTHEWTVQPQFGLNSGVVEFNSWCSGQSSFFFFYLCGLKWKCSILKQWTVYGFSSLRVLFCFEFCSQGRKMS